MRRSFTPLATMTPRRRDILSGLAALIAGSTSLASALADDTPAGTASQENASGDDSPSGENAPGRKGGERQGKFDANGKPLFWPGNTIICPMKETDPLSQAMLDMNALIKSAWSDFIVPTPPSSYHMTILGGFDPEQKDNDNWPAGLAKTMPIADTTAILRDRLAARRFDIPDKIEMKIDLTRFHSSLVGVPLRPANATMTHALYDLRRQIAEAIAFHPDNLMTFMFHATYGYKYRHIPRSRKLFLHRQVHEWRHRSAKNLGTITVSPPVFCRFETMMAFSPLLTLQRAG